MTTTFCCLNMIFCNFLSSFNVFARKMKQTLIKALFWIQKWSLKPFLCYQNSAIIYLQLSLNFKNYLTPFSEEKEHYFVQTSSWQRNNLAFHNAITQIFTTQ